MGWPISLARPSAANASGGGQSEQPLTGFGVPIRFDEAGTAIGASALYGSVAVTPYVSGAGFVSSTNPMPITQVGGATGGYSYAHLAANTATNVKSGAGTLHSITINNPGTSWVVTISDSITTTTPAIAIIAVGTGPATLIFDVAFTTGLRVTGSGTAGDITVSYA